MTPEHGRLVTSEEAGVAFRFEPGVSLIGDMEGQMISNYQIAGEHAARRIKEAVGENPVLEVCTGIGATTFVLARHFQGVYAVDLNLERLQMVKRNLENLGLLEKVELINGDILDEAILKALSSKGISAAYTDVDWSATGDWQEHVSDITTTGPSTVDLYHKLCRWVTPSICMKLPKTINTNQLRELADCEIEAVMPDGKPSFYLVYFGKLAERSSSEFEFVRDAYGKLAK